MAKKVEVWYKDGSSIVVEPVDALELLASEEYFNSNPKEPKKADKEPTVKEIKEQLAELGVEFDASAKKPELAQLLSDTFASQE